MNREPETYEIDFDEEDTDLCNEMIELIKLRDTISGGKFTFCNWMSRKQEKALKLRYETCHNSLIERGIKSPFLWLYPREQKYNPDKKREGKKKRRKLGKLER
jgi:hypothetical protein